MLFLFSIIQNCVQSIFIIISYDYIATTNIDFGGGHSFGINQFDENEIYVGNRILSKKIVIGGSTTDFNSGYHVDVEDMICHPTNSNEVWMSNHGGVYKSVNNGSTWQDMSNGLESYFLLRW